MKGSNSFLWCEYQMIEAVETYLNERVLQKPVKVNSIQFVNHGFEINLEEEKVN